LKVEEDSQFRIYDSSPRRNGIGGVVATGYLPTFTRSDKASLFQGVTQLHSRRLLEEVAVSTIRAAASRPGGQWIGKNCMSVALSPLGEAVARYYSDDLEPWCFGPNFLWSAGGKNWAAKEVSIDPIGGYALKLGGAHGATLVVDSQSELRGADDVKTVADAKIRGLPGRSPDMASGRTDVFGVVRRPSWRS
jgi:hypothetical protein